MQICLCLAMLVASAEAPSQSIPNKHARLIQQKAKGYRRAASLHTPCAEKHHLRAKAAKENPKPKPQRTTYPWALFPLLLSYIIIITIIIYPHYVVLTVVPRNTMYSES